MESLCLRNMLQHLRFYMKMNEQSFYPWGSSRLFFRIASDRPRFSDRDWNLRTGLVHGIGSPMAMFLECSLVFPNPLFINLGVG